MGSRKWGVSLHGSSVKGTWRGAPVPGALKVMKGRLWGLTGAQFGQPVRSPSTGDFQKLLGGSLVVECLSLWEL
jgi:hypothetical protein